ncbi:MAG: ATP-binding cassette domain-containing protein [Gammaproteobacteria bacterium]|nr:ATP-binding cassette domain-containing protein [Gammaproteobacteria bacterium]
MLKFTQFSLRRGTRELLHDVNCTIHAGQRVGVTGANGVGKSSLFALIRGELQPDGGDFSLPPNTVIAHVAQEMPATGQSALEYVIDGDRELRSLQGQIALAENANDGDRLAHLYSELENIHGYSAASRAGKLMHGLGFTSAEEQRPVREFSGGWRMRLNLAQALMCRSDLLLLDEPTNHLDLEAVIWLEEWLQSYPGTLLLISHDRDFLDRVVTHVAHIEQGALTLYTGNYSAFEIRRAEQLANQQAAYEKQQREIAHMQDFVDRFRAKATKARQAQSRIKALERMKVISAAHIDSPFEFHFRRPDRLPDLLLHLERVSIGYADKPVLTNINLNIQTGGRIGLLGFNGAGKSTLIKLLAGEMRPQSGERTEAKDIRIGYFAQHQLEQLDHQASPLLHLQRLDPKATEKELRGFLGGFAFRDDMATSPVAPFSGGEKARLVLAMIVYQKPNLLLLDEPTNHLDLDMRHALSIALQEFEGAMIVVSHDRHLLRTVTDTLLLVADGKVTPFDGDLDDYRQWVKDREREIKTTGDEVVYPVKDNPSMVSTSKKQQRQNAAELRKKLQPLRNKIKTLETQIEKCNQDKTAIQEQLADSRIYEDQNRARLKQLLEQQTATGKQLQQLEELWLAANEELEALEND